MNTYPEDDYDDYEYENIFSENYEDLEYCEWLEDLVVKLLTKDKYIEILDFEKILKKLGIGLKYVEVLHSRVEDIEIRKNNPLLADFPFCVVDFDSQECKKINILNEWEIHTVAKLAQETLEETGYLVRSDDYKKFLKKLEPYKCYFLKQTWDRLSEKTISEYMSVRVDESIPWSETNSHRDNIVYDIEKLVQADSANERFLSIDADLNKGLFYFWRYKDLGENP